VGVPSGCAGWRKRAGPALPVIAAGRDAAATSGGGGSEAGTGAGFVARAAGGFVFRAAAGFAARAAVDAVPVASGLGPAGRAPRLSLRRCGRR